MVTACAKLLILLGIHRGNRSIETCGQAPEGGRWLERRGTSGFNDSLPISWARSPPSSAAWAGRGRIPADRYSDWAVHCVADRTSRRSVLKLLRLHTYNMLFVKAAIWKAGRSYDRTGSLFLTPLCSQRDSWRKN